MRKIFVTGIGTDVGKTVISAMLVEALKADYWKPVQSGSFFSTDSATIKNLISNEVSVIHPESYSLKEHKSPHEAAANENVIIDPNKIILPACKNKTLIIEGAGGLLVPLTDDFFIIDLIKKFDAEVVVVTQNYLGSINHTLLTVDALKNRGLNIVGLVFCGSPHVPSENIVLKFSGVPRIAHVAKEDKVDKATILKYAKSFENI